MYEPTDEQIEALAKADAFINGATETEWDNGTGVGSHLWITDTRALTKSPAFQAIIRAAQAEALREAAGVAEAYSNWKADTAFHVASILRERADRIESADV